MLVFGRLQIQFKASWSGFSWIVSKNLWKIEIAPNICKYVEYENIKENQCVLQLIAIKLYFGYKTCSCILLSYSTIHNSFLHCKYTENYSNWMARDMIKNIENNEHGKKLNNMKNWIFKCNIKITMVWVSFLYNIYFQECNIFSSIF